MRTMTLAGTLAALAAGMLAVPADAEWRKVIVKESEVREKASPDAKVIKVLEKGRYVNQVNSDGVWKKITEPVEGWISGKDLSDYTAFKNSRLFEVKVKAANIRADHNKSSKRLKTVKKFQNLKVVGKYKDWKKISSPFHGWSHEMLVRFGLKRYVKEGPLNVRSGPSQSASVKKTLKRRDAIHITEKKGDWRHIDRPNHGWVHSKYLSTKRPKKRSSGGGNVGPSFWGTAYKYGRSYRIELVRIDGKAVAKKSAGPFLSMRAAAGRAGVRIYVVSGFRTMSEQQYLWNLYGSPRAARPGYSNHQSGTAFDLNTAGFGGSVYNWLTAHAWSYGFKRTVSFEPWHWEYMR